MKFNLKTFLKKPQEPSTDSISSIQEFLAKLREVNMPVISPSFPEERLLPIHAIAIIGFHHKLGSIVEFKYPPESEESNLLPYLALPDCAHNEEVTHNQSDFSYFIVRISGKERYGISCFRQVPNLEKNAEMNRNYVQKSVTVISNVPFFGHITSRMMATTQAYFEQGNFKNTTILSDMYSSLCSGLDTCSATDLYVGFSPRKLIYTLKDKIMILWKLILLESKILVYSKTASKVSSAIMAICSLFPGQLSFGCRDRILSSYMLSLKDYGLPLEIFHENNLCAPYFSIFQLDSLNSTGFLIGCTNPMILQSSKTKPKAVFNIDTGKLDVIITGANQRMLKLNTSEKKFIKPIVKSVEDTLKHDESWLGTETLEWMGSDDFIRNKFHNYLKNILTDLAFLRLKLQFKHKDRTESWIEDCIACTDSSDDSLIDEESKSSNTAYQIMNPIKVKTIRNYEKYLTGLRKSFLVCWSNTRNFKTWLEEHPSDLAGRSSFANYIRKAVIHYENGDVFVGELNNGKRQGVGILEEKSGDKYEGSWLNDLKSGTGTYTSKAQDKIYDGDWREDMRWGNGREITQFYQYSGSFFKNLYSGSGILVDKDGSVYDGDWKMGKKSGDGHWQNTTGDSYRGEFKDNSIHGRGQYNYANGDVYSGYFKNGKRYGPGEIIKQTGEEYAGDFVNDALEGRGSITKINGDKITGIFKRGEMLLDNCQIEYKDGRVYIGEVSSDIKPHGKGVMHMVSGNIIPGLWENGLQKI